MQLIGPAATEDFGARVATICKPPLIVYLVGDLGSGKTTFVRGFVHALGHTGTVKSPTFTLVETYIFEQITLYHFDLYRLQNTQELEYLGMRDIASERDTICLIEWPEQGGGGVPDPDLVFKFEHQGENRTVYSQGESSKGQAITSQL